MVERAANSHKGAVKVIKSTRNKHAQYNNYLVVALAEQLVETSMAVWLIILLFERAC